MKRPFKAFIAAVALTLALVLPASAGAKTGTVLWQCDPDGGGPEQTVTFVSAPAAADSICTGRVIRLAKYSPIHVAPTMIMSVSIRKNERYAPVSGCLRTRSCM